MYVPESATSLVSINIHRRSWSADILIPPPQSHMEYQCLLCVPHQRQTLPLAMGGPETRRCPIGDNRHPPRRLRRCILKRRSESRHSQCGRCICTSTCQAQSTLNRQPPHSPGVFRIWPLPGPLQGLRCTPFRPRSRRRRTLRANSEPRRAR